MITSLVQPLVTSLVGGVVGNDLGVELVVNGNFSDGLNGWSAGRDATLSIDASRLKVANGLPTNFSGYAIQNITVEVGKTYRIKANTYVVDLNTDVRIGNAPESSIYKRFNAAGNQVIDDVFTAISTSLAISLFVSGGVDGQYSLFDNISVREVT